MPFLNVVNGRTYSRIDTAGMEDISQLQDAIKAKYGEFIAASSVAIQLYKSYSDVGRQKGDALITELEEIPEEYFKKRKDGGLALEIRTSPPPSKQSALLNIVPFPPKSGAVHEGLPDAAQKLVIHRSALVKRISETMERQMSLLITSPSFTGKANLAYNHWQQSGETFHYISFAAIKKEDALDEFFRSAIGLSPRNIMRHDGYLRNTKNLQPSFLLGQSEEWSASLQSIGLRCLWFIHCWK
jgi:hypothetical protein